MLKESLTYVKTILYVRWNDISPLAINVMSNKSGCFNKFMQVLLVLMALNCLIKYAHVHGFQLGNVNSIVANIPTNVICSLMFITSNTTNIKVFINKNYNFINDKYFILFKLCNIIFFRCTELIITGFHKSIFTKCQKYLLRFKYICHECIYMFPATEAPSSCMFINQVFPAVISGKKILYWGRIKTSFYTHKKTRAILMEQY